MKKIILSVLIMTTLVFSWTIEEVIESEGVQTNVIKCNNGEIKAIYFSSKSGKYEVTPTLMFDTLEEASTNVCGE